MTNNYEIFEDENHLRPNFAKSEFDSLTSWDFGWAILEPINLGANDEVGLSQRLSPGQKALYFFWYLDAEVTNGGFIQFYWNGNRKYLPAIIKGLELIGDRDMLKLVDIADKLYLENKDKIESGGTQEDFSRLYDDLIEFDDLDRIFYDKHDKTMDLIEKYARQNPEEFVNLK
ncbi:DMP19 family protein [Flavobacterium nitrogenifigens]|uniref:DMP19 family protein n=1 Tax=Flavobacterium nitrogenifigens TaxID=1617283 RepID=UPI0031AF257A